MKKEYVLDTSLLMHDPYSIYNFKDNDITLTTITLRELGNLKSSKNSEKARVARKANRLLDELTAKYGTQKVTLSDEKEERGFLSIKSHSQEILNEIRLLFSEPNNDDKILAVAIEGYRKYQEKKKELKQQLNKLYNKKKYFKKEKEDDSGIEKLKADIKFVKKQLRGLKPVIFVTKDIELRVKARTFNIPVQDYINDKLEVVDSYKGWKIITVPDNVVDLYYEQKRLHKENEENKDIEFFFDVDKSIFDIEKYEFNANEYVFLVKESKSPLTDDKLVKIHSNPKALILRYDVKKNKLCPLRDKYMQYLKNYKIEPRNAEQRILIDMLFDEKRPFKTVTGIAGTGKTLFVLLASIIMTNDLNLFDEIIITRPIIPMGEDIGFLPGDEQDKLGPWMRPIIHNLKFITYQKSNGGSKDGHLEASMYKITPVAPTYLRGNTLPRVIVILDEGQNANKHFWKTIGTRIGEGSIFIGIGDLNQIDHPYLDKSNCGLAYGVEKMKNQNLAYHCNMVLGERSEISKLVAETWD